MMKKFWKTVVRFAERLFGEVVIIVLRYEKSAWLMIAVLLMIAIAHYPFLTPGYGKHWDCTKLAWVAQHIAETGEYTMSRLPGHPLQEIACSCVWELGPIGINGLTALMSVLVVLFIMLIMRHFKIKDDLWVGIAISITPLFFINSVNAKDFIWAMAFSWMAFYALVKRMPLLAGVLLGAAVGCRLTAAVMIVPFCIYLGLVSESKGRAIKDIIWGLAGVIVVTVICYAPVYHVYHWGFLRSVRVPAWQPRPGLADYPDLIKGIWGGSAGAVIFGLIMAAIGGAWMAIKRKLNPLNENYNLTLNMGTKSGSYNVTGVRVRNDDNLEIAISSEWLKVGKMNDGLSEDQKRLVITLVFAFFSHLAAFVYYPYDPAYLLPVVPIVFILIAMFAPRPTMIIIAILMIIGLGSMVEPSILVDHYLRNR